MIKLSKQFLIILLSAVLLFLLGYVSILLAQSSDDYFSSDFYHYWLAGRMIGTGLDPYNTSQWVENTYRYGIPLIYEPMFLYPLPLGLLFVPLGLLPLKAAEALWICLILLFLFVSIYLIFRNTDIRRLTPYIAPGMFSIILFRPFITTLYWGQLASFLLFLIVLIVFILERNKWFLGGLILPVLLDKPQVGVPIVGLVGFWLLTRKKWPALLGLSVTSLLTLIISLLIDPAWIVKWLASGTQKLTLTFGHSVTIWGTASIACGFNSSCSLWLGSILSVFLILFCLYFLVKTKTTDLFPIFGIIICVSLIITPFLLINDHLLLLFPIIVAFNRMRLNNYSYWLLSAMLISFPVLSTSLVPLKYIVNSEGFNAIIPLLILIELGIAYFYNPGSRKITMLIQE